MKRAYICDYCDKIFSEEDIEQHEDECEFNPKNRTCFTCEYCITDYEENIKCSAKDIISVTIFNKDIITRNCDRYEEGNPTELLCIDEGN